MMKDALYAKLNAIREDYRGRMNRAAAEAERWAANGEDMEKVSMFSTESERAREAFTACNRMIAVLEADVELSDLNDLDEVAHVLGVEDSDTTPAARAREWLAEIERLRAEVNRSAA